MAVMRVKDALEAAPGTTLTLRGWVRTRRDSKAGLSFIELHDGSCFASIQVVARQDLPNYQDQVLRLTTGCSVEVQGTLVPSKGKGQAVEVQAEDVRVVGWVDDPDTYPISAKRHSYEYLREVAHLRPRTNTFGAMARVRHRLAQSIHRYLDEQGYLWVHTPIISVSDAEGAGDMFRVSTLDLLNLPRTPDGSDVNWQEDFFHRAAYLTVSGQLNVEAYCCALSRVYTFGPTFRAENSNTSRHLAEFWMIEPEIAFADLKDNAALAEGLLKHVLDELLTRCADDVAFFDQRLEPGLIDKLRHVIDSPFRMLPYTEAIEILQGSGQDFQFPVRWGADLQSEHERYLTERAFGQPVVVVDYPKEIKSFYMRLNDDGKTVAAMDVLVPGVGEIIGGSQREERLDVLDRRMEEKARHHAASTTRGTGTCAATARCRTRASAWAFERLVMYCTGLGNIRDAIPFPRAAGQAAF
ncbi:MAG: asparagine--tRNA ligase [Phycisphaerales bacterium]|nr:MAG: asparagine--tRNA ligase [Phycisphaerales bacterium]